jgi:hypothetical protein
MTTRVKILAIDYKTTGFIVPDGHRLVTVYPHFNMDGGATLAVVLEEDGSQSEDQAGASVPQGEDGHPVDGEPVVDSAPAGE